MYSLMYVMYDINRASSHVLWAQYARKIVSHKNKVCTDAVCYTEETNGLETVLDRRFRRRDARRDLLGGLLPAQDVGHLVI